MTVLARVLPELPATQWIANEDRDGVLHDATCEGRGTSRLYVARLADLRRGDRYCPICGPTMLTASGSVGAMLLRLTERLAALVTLLDDEPGAAPAGDAAPARRAEASRLALLILLDGSNRAVPAEDFARLRVEVLLPVLRAGVRHRHGALRVFTAGDFRRANKPPERLLGPHVTALHDGFLHYSPQGSLIFYVDDEQPLTEPTRASRRHHGPTEHLPGTLLEKEWQPDLFEAVETMSFFGDEALRGRGEWADLRDWWETAKLL
jgi:hypothetical protein